MPNEVEDFLKDVKGDVVVPDPFKNESDDPFTDKNGKTNELPTGDGKDAETDPNAPTKDADADGKVPFHKDPKVQKFIEKEIEKRIKGIKPDAPLTPAAAQAKAEDNEDLVSAFTTIIGNDTPEKVHALKMLKKALGDVEEKAVSKAMNRLQEIAAEEKAADSAAENELSNGFESVEETYGVDLTSNLPVAVKLRNDFIDFIKRVAPKDQDGEVVQFPDFAETFKIFQETRKPTANRAKDLAGRSMNRSADASAVKPTTGNSWKDVDKAFSKLT